LKVLPKETLDLVTKDNAYWNSLPFSIVSNFSLGNVMQSKLGGEEKKKMRYEKRKGANS